MRLENLIELTGGKLLNLPSITSVDQICLNSNKVKRGDLYICPEHKKLEEALKNGAYAVICEGDPKITDNEIAWIRVDSIDDTLIKLLRYKLIKSKFSFYSTNEIEYQIIKTIVKSKKIIFLDDNIEKNFKKIIKANLSTIFISKEKEVLTKIAPNFKELKESKNKLLKEKRSALFYSSFFYKKTFFKKIKIPSMFLGELEKVLHFLDKEELPYDLNNIRFSSIFDPVFINKNLQKRDFGHSEQVLIFEKNVKWLKKDIEYLTKKAKWSKNIAFLPKDFLNKDIEMKNIIFYENENEILKLKDLDFNFALIFADKDKIFDILEKKENTPKRGRLL